MKPTLLIMILLTAAYFISAYFISANLGAMHGSVIKTKKLQIEEVLR